MAPVSMTLSDKIKCEQTLKDPKPQISRSDHSLTLNTSEMAKDTAIVTMEGE